VTITRLISVLALAVIGGAGVSAQAPAVNKQRFEVASVKPSAPGAQGQSLRRPPNGQFTASNIPLRDIIALAYGVADFPWRLDGVPDWAANERFDIVAKSATAVPPVRPGSPDPILMMVRTLLEERFRMTIHAENREMPVYALVLAKPGTLGRDLKKSEVDCDAIQLARLTAGARGETPPPPLTPAGRPLCGFAGVQGGGPGKPGGMQAGGIPMWQLANRLTVFVGRTVVDRTGLEGYYDWQLLFSPPGAADQSGGSIFTALQEQMGLKLESTRAPVEVWVVDRVERPTPD
jgi:uncharacterized protein (TIGR03435 family)